MRNDVFERDLFAARAGSARAAGKTPRLFGAQQGRRNGHDRDRDRPSGQPPEPDGALLADLGVRREVLVRQHIERGERLRALRVATARQQVEECADQFLQNLGLLVAIDDDQQRPFDDLPQQNQVQRLRGRLSDRKAKAAGLRRACQLAHKFLERGMARELSNRSRTAG